MRPVAALLALASSVALAHEPPRTPLEIASPLARHARDLPVTTQAFVRLARSLGPAVVNVSTWQTPAADAPTGRPRGRGQGTGFVIEKSGFILTNHHVVDNAEQIRVRLADERDFVARLIGQDAKTDIAVVKIDPPAALPVALLGDSDRVEIGEWVMAIGNPFGLDHTVTAGIVSAKGRRDVRPGGSTTGYYDFIQTDASINVGNSGGPLINLRGEVIGINTAMTAQAQGIAFAIPINMAKAIAPLLIAHGHAPRAWLGVYPQSVTAALGRAFGLKSTRGALVSDVVPGGPAAEAGIESGDLVLEFDGHPIRRADDLEWWVGLGGAGRTVSVSLVHHGKTKKLDVLLGAQPDQPAASPPPAKQKGHASPLGMTVAEISAGIARELHQPDLRGVVVMAVEPESPAAEAGVERGDILLRVGDTVVTSLDDYARAVRALAKGEMLKLLARREGHNLWLAFEKR